MKSRYFYLAAAIGFLTGAVYEIWPPRNTTAAVLDAVSGALFLSLFLGATPGKPKL